MKSIKKIMLICTLAILLSPSLMAQKKVAVVTFYVDKYVDTEQLGGGAALVAAIGSLSEDENFDLKDFEDNLNKNIETMATDLFKLFDDTYNDYNPELINAMKEKDTLYNLEEFKKADKSDEV